MKPVSLTQTLILIVILGVAGATVGWSDETSEPNATDFLKIWQAWNTSKAYYKYYDLSLEYQYETHNWGGVRETSRLIIHLGEGKHNPFGTLEAMRTLDRLHNVQAHPKYKDTFTMILTNALTLKEGHRVETLPAKLTCQMDQGRPRRFIFYAEPPKRWLTQSVRVVYTWNNFRQYDEEFYWVPVEILMEYLVERSSRQAVLSEQWTLKQILQGPRGGADSPQPVLDNP